VPDFEFDETLVARAREIARVEEVPFQEALRRVLLRYGASIWDKEADLPRPDDGSTPQQE